jgi:U4/U6.U5 tri-snRNP component SNU23
LKSHQMRSGQSGEVKRATLEDVQDRLRYLSRKRKEASKVDRRDEEERAREEKRKKRNEKRRAKKQEDEW